MKYNIVLTASLLTALLVSCTREELGVDVQEEQPQVTISASIVGAPGTKTSMGDESTTGGKFSKGYYPVYWSENDKIALFSKNSIGVFKLETVHTDDNTVADFVGDAGNMPLKREGTDVFPAAYPADKAFAELGTDGKLLVGSYLPHTQTYKDGTFADNVFPMASVSKDGENFDFYNLGGVLQIRIKGTEAGQKIRAIYLSGRNGEVVAGGVGMKFDPMSGAKITEGIVDGDENNGYKIAKYGDEGYTQIIMNFTEPLELSTTDATDINIAVIPQTFTNGIKVEIMDAKNMGIFMTTANTVTIKRSVVTRLEPDLDYSSPEPAQVANSYVYSDTGYYLMPAYAMGNRMDVPLDPNNAHPNKAADLLWSELITVDHNTTDRNDLIPAVTNIEYISSPDGYGMLQFKINEDPSTCSKNEGQPIPGTGHAYRGNAAIALYDVDTKEVLWSWHIWMCEPVHDVVTGGYCSSGTYTYSLPDGTTVEYAAEASSNNTLVIMDRNLGAISADPADGWKTYGLYYQNGRRDPFIGGHWDGNPAPSSSTLEAYTGTKDQELSIHLNETAPFSVAETQTAPVWYNEELAPKGWSYLPKYQNVSTALRFPMTFSSGYDPFKNGQWTDYTDDDNKSWMDPNAGSGNKKGGTTTGGTHGNTGLSDGGHQSYWNRTKTIMDPCPVGYSVLGESNGKYINGDTTTYIWEGVGGTAAGITHPDHAVYGMMTQKTGYDPVWWPAAGVRTIKGKLGDVGYRGFYFHYDHIANQHGGHGSGFYYNSNWAVDQKTNHAASVRCVREKQDISRYPLK